jgi:hypothetical protein
MTNDEGSILAFPAELKCRFEGGSQELQPDKQSARHIRLIGRVKHGIYTHMQTASFGQFQ